MREKFELDGDYFSILRLQLTITRLNRYLLFFSLTFSFIFFFHDLCCSQGTTGEKKISTIRFANFTEANIGISDCISYGVRVSSGIQIKSKLYFGVGVGYDYYRRINNYGGTALYYKIYEEPKFDLQVIPLYLDIRYPVFKRNELTIDFCLSGGLSILISDPTNEVEAQVGGTPYNGGYFTEVLYKYGNGNLFYAGFGFIHKLSSSLNLLYGFGYHHAGIVLTDPYNAKYYVGEFIAIRIGVGF